MPGSSRPLWEATRAKHERIIAQRRAQLGLVAGGDEPVYCEDFLVEVWRLHASGRDADARTLLVGIWSWAMDGVREERDVRVTLRLFDRLGLSTDDAERWASLPGELRVYRAESNPGDPRHGFCWTLEREVAGTHASRHGLPVTEGTVAKADVLAFVTHQGEDEIVVRREHVRDARVVPTPVPTPE